MHPSPAPRRRLAIAMRAALIATFAITVFAPTANATSVSAAESCIIGWINSARSARGLVPLRPHSSLTSISGLRASRMASSNTMSHTIGGNLASQLNSYNVSWYRYGENVGWSTAGWPSSSARAIFNMWMNSPSHKALILSDRFNYIGVGLAYRSSNRKTFGAAVFGETVDYTRAVGRMTGGTRSGNDLRWTWSGYDPKLQTHTAGLRNYDVQYRINYGTWVLLRNDTTATSLSLPDRSRGRSYAVRVRATDRRGNVGAWSAEKRLWVP
jgi:uncharacterized protein YkwD